MDKIGVSKPYSIKSVIEWWYFRLVKSNEFSDYVHFNHIKICYANEFCHKSVWQGRYCDIELWKHDYYLLCFYHTPEII